jgi:hypothetical protein
LLVIGVSGMPHGELSPTFYPPATPQVVPGAILPLLQEAEAMAIKVDQLQKEGFGKKPKKGSERAPAATIETAPQTSS